MFLEIKKVLNGYYQMVSYLYFPFRQRLDG